MDSAVYEKEIRSLDELSFVAKKILQIEPSVRLFLFYAPMGAGKTTLIKECCIALGSQSHFSSPTYSIINEYDAPNSKIYHFDLYRLKNEEEVYDLGIEDYISGEAYCFFEWPHLVEKMIDVSYLKIEIELKENIRYLRAFLI